MDKKYQVLGIGNSIVDVLGFVNEDFLETHNLNKAAMTLINESQAEILYKDLGQTTEVSGGSAANTVAGIASLGGSAAFIGRVRDDELGKIFKHDLNAVGVDYDSAFATEGKTTARCLVMVTPDAERTMATFLGACTELDESDIDEELIKNSEVIYIEGYLWDEPNAKAAISKAIKIAKENGVKTAFTCSDPFCVSRHKDEFLELLKDIDILFANEEEAKMLFDVENVADAAKKAKTLGSLVALTKGAEGSVIINEGELTEVAASAINELVDTTGAGDLYAAGFLHALTSGKSLAECGQLGGFAAGNIIQQLGARPLKPLKDSLAA